MDPAYASISNDRVSITLTLAQWTTVIAISAEPGELVQLAAVAAGQFVDEAVWQLPARFPEEFAMKLAAQLSPEQGGSNLDLHLAQEMSSLPDMLDRFALDTSPTNLASRVLAERAKRLNTLNEQDRSQRDQKIASAYVEVSTAQERELSAQRELNRAVQENTLLNDKLAEERRLKEEASKDLIRQNIRHQRLFWSIGIVLGTIVCFVLALIYGGILARIGAGISFGASLLLTIQWCRNLESRLHVLIWGVAIESLGALSAIQSLIFPQS